MSRHLFLQSLTALLGGFALACDCAEKTGFTIFKPLEADWKILQISSVAGFQYYQGEALWPPRYRSADHARADLIPAIAYIKGANHGELGCCTKTLPHEMQGNYAAGEKC